MKASFYVRDIKRDTHFTLLVDSHLAIELNDHLFVQSNPDQDFIVVVQDTFGTSKMPDHSDFFTTYNTILCRKISHNHVEEPIVFATTEPEIYNVYKSYGRF